MTIALVFIGVTALAAVVALAYITLRARTSPGPPLTGRTLVVHTRRPDDQTLRGILVGQHADRLVLRDAVHVHASGETAAGGLVHVPLVNIAWAQEIEA